jgi:hypothetical protein
VRLEGLGQLKNPITSSGIEPAACSIMPQSTMLPSAPNGIWKISFCKAVLHPMQTDIIVLYCIIQLHIYDEFHRRVVSNALISDYHETIEEYRLCHLIMLTPVYKHMCLVYCETHRSSNNITLKY